MKTDDREIDGENITEPFPNIDDKVPPAIHTLFLPEQVE